MGGLNIFCLIIKSNIFRGGGGVLFQGSFMIRPQLREVSSGSIEDARNGVSDFQERALHSDCLLWANILALQLLQGWHKLEFERLMQIKLMTNFICLDHAWHPSAAASFCGDPKGDQVGIPKLFIPITGIFLGKIKTGVDILTAHRKERKKTLKLWN